MSEPAKTALVIAHEPDGSAGQVAVRLAERGFAVDTHVVTEHQDRPNEFAAWPAVDGYDLIVPMGSIRSLTRKEEIDAWIETELDLLRIAHEADTPILGVCFGGQLIAEALGGSVEAAPVTELGWFEIESAPDADNPVGPGPWKEWHHDRFTPPPQSEVLAVSEHAVQLFRMGRTVGTQFHPEVDVDHIAKWLSTCDDEYLAEHGTTRERVLADVQANEEANIKQCHALVDWFLDDVAFPQADAHR